MELTATTPSTIKTKKDAKMNNKNSMNLLYFTLNTASILLNLPAKQQLILPSV